jgi:adenylate kinase
MDAGELVPDSVVIGLVADRLKDADTDKGFILDGFPRTTAQAEALDAELVSLGKEIDSAVAVDVDPEIIIGRLTSRRTCRECGRITNVSEGARCDACGGELYQRDDDNETTVRNRLDVYAKSTAPLIDYYGAKGLLHSIDGDRPVDEVWADVRSVLEG